MYAFVALKYLAPMDRIQQTVDRHRAYLRELHAAGKLVCSGPFIPREGGGFGLQVKLRVEDKSLPQAELAALAKEAHEKICPYSHATRNNVDVQIEVAGS